MTVEKIRSEIATAERLMDELSKAAARKGESTAQAFRRLVADRDEGMTALVAAHDAASRALTQH